MEETKTETPEIVSNDRWKEIEAKFAEPFPVKDILFRPLRKRGNVYEVAAYLDKVSIITRLNEVVGSSNWEYDFTPLVLDMVKQKVSQFNEENGQMETTVEPVKEMTRAKGWIKIHGRAGKSALGDSSNMFPSKGCDSDTFKRAAVMWGVGAFLYGEKGLTVPANMVQYGKIQPDEIARLRNKMAVKFGLDAVEVPAAQQNQGYQNQGGGNRGGNQNAPQVTPEERKARTSAMTEYNKAIKEMALPFNPDAQQVAIAAALGVESFNFNTGSVKDIQNVARWIREGEVTWEAKTPSE